MNTRGSKRKSTWIAILAIALLMTALQAKLGVYHPEQSQAQLISKTFKVSECRLERAVPAALIVTVDVVTPVVETDDEWRSEPDFVEFSSSQLSPPLSHSHWFRPPPRS